MYFDILYNFFLKKFSLLKLGEICSKTYIVLFM